jgi:hypothetical protein
MSRASKSGESNSRHFTGYAEAPRIPRQHVKLDITLNAGSSLVAAVVLRICLAMSRVGCSYHDRRPASSGEAPAAGKEVRDDRRRVKRSYDQIAPRPAAGLSKPTSMTAETKGEGTNPAHVTETVAPAHQASATLRFAPHLTPTRLCQGAAAAARESSCPRKVWIRRLRGTRVIVPDRDSLALAYLCFFG